MMYKENGVPTFYRGKMVNMYNTLTPHVCTHVHNHPLVYVCMYV